MLDQKLFDTVAKHLLTQGAKSLDGAGGCRYRGEHDRKCAVGVLIPDKLYSPQMETYAANTGEVQLILERLELDIELCMELQAVHDDVDVDDWASELRYVAKLYDLDAAIVEAHG